MPDPQFTNIQSPPLFYGCDAQVSVLIEKERCCGIEDAIDNNFIPLEARMIKSIPLCFTNAEDKLYWPSMVDGAYSVKAGYRFLIDNELISNVNPLASPHLKSTWKGLWKLRIPNRTKTLMWRAISNALPTRVNLVKRKVPFDATCQLCGLEQESTLHALWSCPKLNGIWDVHFNSLRDEAKERVSFLEVFQMCLEKGHPSDMLTMLTSHVWLRRNKLRLGEIVADLRLLNYLAKDALLEFQPTHSAVPSPPSTHSQVKWEPPPTDWFKINFDGAVSQEMDEAGLGIIIRNDHGLIMTALTQVIPLLTSVEMVEVLVARRALIFALELSFDHIILEGDSNIAIRAMMCDSYSAASFGHILSDIKSLDAQFRHVVFSHTRRQGNKVAHNLARAACNFYPFCTWIEEIPIVFVVDCNAELFNE